jgi:hypothetical protein
MVVVAVVATRVVDWAATVARDWPGTLLSAHWAGMARGPARGVSRRAAPLSGTMRVRTC